MSYSIPSIVSNTEALLKLRHDETLTSTTPQRLHDCLGQAVMMALNQHWTNSKKAREGHRKAYYFSAEYLMGRLVYSGPPEPFFGDRDAVSLAGLTIPHTFSVNRSVEGIRGRPEAPYPRTESQLLAKMAPPEARFGRISVRAVPEDGAVPDDGGALVGIYGFRTRRLFDETGSRADVYFDAIEGCCLGAMQGRDAVLYCDPELVDVVRERIRGLSAFGRAPEVVRWRI